MSDYEAAFAASLIGVYLLVWFVAAAIGILGIVAKWKIYEKAGEPGWAALIPFYKSYVLFKISWGNGWFFLFSTVPAIIYYILYFALYAGLIGRSFDYPYESGYMASSSIVVILLMILIGLGLLVVSILTNVKLAKVFNQGGGFACGLIFVNIVFLCIIAFNKGIFYVGIPGKTPTYGNGYGQQNYQQPGYQSPYLDPYTQQNNYQQQSAQNSQYYYQQPTAQSALKYCSSCGSQIDTNGKFCPKCGKPQ